MEHSPRTRAAQPRGFFRARAAPLAVSLKSPRISAKSRFVKILEFYAVFCQQQLQWLTCRKILAQMSETAQGS
jgi:hypothetical protein